MRERRSAAQAAAEDIFFGQVVIIWARWFVILTSALLALWTATTIGELSTNILLVIALMAMNFYLHGRYLLERPANQGLMFAAGLLDLAVITAIVVTWQGQGGLPSQFFVFYYPVLLAFAFVFPPRITAVYTGLALLAYTIACLLADPAIVTSALWSKTLVVRLLTLASMGGLGTFYWRIQRERRHAASGSPVTQPDLRLGLPPTAGTV